MSEINKVFCPGQSIAYRLLLNNHPLVESWGRYKTRRLVENKPHHVFEFIQVLNKTVLGQGEDRVFSLAELTCTGKWLPLSYTIVIGNKQTRIEFANGKFKALMPDGTPFSGTTEKSDFILAGNMVPQLSYFIRTQISKDQPTYEGAFFSPETLQKVPYTLTRTVSGLQSNLGEQIRLNQDGWITRISFNDPALRVELVEEKFPDWDRVQKKTVPEFTYKSPPNICVTDIKIPCPAITIGGSMAKPRSGTPRRLGVLFIGGSGNHDRHGFGNGVDLGYHELLDSLAAEGVVSLRVDKRGCGTTLVGENFMDLGFDDIVNDARSVFKFFEACPEVKDLPLFLMGHSEGGLIALILAAEEARIKGAVLLATAASDMEKILENQIRNQSDHLKLPDKSKQLKIHEMKELLTWLRKPGEWEQKDVPDRIWALRRVRKWYRQLLRKKPLALVAESDIPLLILQGGADVQVQVSDAQNLFDTAGPGQAKLHIFPDLDHLFKQSQGPNGIHKYYTQRPFDSQVIDTIKTWLMDHVSRELQ